MALVAFCGICCATSFCADATSTSVASQSGVTAEDGKGINDLVLAEGGREGQHGLRGIRERAELMGGKLTLWSALGSGTEVELSLVASRTHTKARAPGLAVSA